jgi:sulfur-carrier protein adenylyltransferase/sulfurtransferase
MTNPTPPNSPQHPTQSSSFAEHVRALQQAFALVEPPVAQDELVRGALLLDVREAMESTQSARGSQRVPRGYLELRIEALATRERRILLMCQSGTRALLAAQNLRDLGYQNLAVVRGGFDAWKRAELPLEELGSIDSARYDRQLRLPEFGEAAQRKLASARVLLVGAGGLGSPAALYLAAAGVGAGRNGVLAIADGDQVELSNLHRQIIHRSEHIGMDKTLSASIALRALNRDVNVRTLPRIERETIDSLLPNFDCVLDGSDNFATRFLLADACVKHRKPLVYGAVLRFEGHVSVFAPERGTDMPCYRCLFPEAPPAEHAPNCAEAGVLGVLPGIIGSLQALQVMQLLGGFGEPLLGRLLIVDALTNQFRQLKIPRDLRCGCNAPDSIVYRADTDAACVIREGFR